MYFSKGNRTLICPSSSPLTAVMVAIMGKEGKLLGIRCLREDCVCETGAQATFCCLFCRMEKKCGHMLGINQPTDGRVIECELQLKLQTAERESMARGPGFGTKLFIISLKGRSAAQWISLAKLTACSLSALLHFAAVLRVQAESNPVSVSLLFNCLFFRFPNNNAVLLHWIIR